MKQYLFTLLCLSLWPLGLMARFTGGETASTARTPLAFVENKGQILNVAGQPCPEVLYVAQHNGVQIYFQRQSVSYVFQEQAKAGTDSRTGVLRADVRWLDANPAATVQTTGASAAVRNYYLPHCPQGITGVRSFEGITYKNIYPNIDLVFSIVPNGGQQALKYEYHVHPGGNPQLIKAQYVGFKGLDMARNGDVNASTALGNLVEEAPIVYQGRPDQVVSSRFAIKNGILSYDLGAYDPQQTLVIDPLTRQWATNFGGNVLDRAQSVTIDGSGNVSYTGFSTGAGFPTTVGAIQRSFAGGTNDIEVASFTSTGTLRWATYYGGSGLDQADGIAVNGNNNLLIAGYSASTDIPTAGFGSGAPFQATNGGSGDAFLLSLDNSGLRRWATFYGGNNNDQFFDVAAFATGNNFAIVGRTFSNGLTTTGAAQSAIAGQRDALLTVFDENGARQWATYWGGTNDDQGFGVAVDNNNNVVITGQTRSTGLTTAGVVQATLGGNLDAYIAKYSPAGAIAWSTYYGGLANDLGESIATDPTGNVYITGSTSSTNFNLTRSFQSAIGGLTDAFVAGVNPAGTSRVVSSFIGGGGTDQGWGVSCIGNTIYVAGATNSNDFPFLNPTVAVNLPAQTALGGGFDIFLTRIDPTSGTAPFARTWSILYGGRDDEAARDLSTTATGTIALSGYTNNATFPTLNPVAGQAPAFTGNDDAALIYFSESAGDCPTVAVTTQVLAVSCFGQSTGEVTVTAPLGTNFSYSLAGAVSRTSQANPTFSALPAGTYTITARNTTNNCAYTSSSVVLPQSPEIVANPTSTVANCGVSNGSITITASGGSGALRYRLGTSGTFGTGTTFTGLPAGTVTYQIQDELGCIFTGNVTIVSNRFSFSTGQDSATCGQPNGNARPVSFSTTPVSPTFPVTCTLFGGGSCGVNQVGQVVIINGTPGTTGTPPVSVLFPNPVETFRNLAAGTYCMSCVDAANCPAETQLVRILSKGTPPTITFASPVANPSCTGGTVTATVQISGGTAPYIVTSSSGTASVVGNVATITGITAGVLTVSVRENGGCTSNTLTQNITPPTALTATVTATQVNCNPTNPVANASITVTPSGGTGPYSAFSTNGTFTSPTVSGPGVLTIVGTPSLPAGVHTITLTDAAGCTLTPAPTVTIDPSNAPTISLVTVTNPTCIGRTDGTITIDIIGGQAPYRFQLGTNPAGIPTANTSNTFADLAPGTYTVRVLDNRSCTVETTLTVVNPLPLRIERVSITAPSFCNSPDGVIEVTAIGGTGTLTFGISNDPTVRPTFVPGTQVGTRWTLPFSLLPADYYYIYVRDQNNDPTFCEVRIDTALNDPGAPRIVNVRGINAICANDPTKIATGQIIVNATFSSFPIFYSISGVGGPFVSGTSTTTFPGLPPSDCYKVVVSSTNDPLGCKAFTKCVSVGAPAPILVTNVSIVQPNCPAAGSMTITATGGIPPYNYSVGGFGTVVGNTITNLVAKSDGYDLVVRDANGCAVPSGTYFLFNANGLELSSATVVAPSCGSMNGRITVTPRGGRAPYRVRINGGMPMMSTGSAVTFTGIGAGNYVIEATDADNCSVIRSQVINSLLVTRTTTAPTCGNNNAGMSLRIGGGMGNYRVCFTSITFNGANLSTAPTVTTTPTCTTVVAGADGFATAGFTSLRPGTYFVEVNDIDQPGICIFRDTVRLMPVGGPSVTNVVKIDRNCNIVNGAGTQGTISVQTFGPVTGMTIVNTSLSTPVVYNQTVTGGPGSFSFTFTDPNFLPAGTYQVYARNATNCLSIAQPVTIAQPNPITISDVRVTNPVCGATLPTGTIEVLASGGRTLQYAINPPLFVPGNVFTGVPAGPAVYTVTVRESGLTTCQSTWPAPVSIINGSGLDINANSFVQPSCPSGSNGTITVSWAAIPGSGPFDVFLNGTLIENITATTYTYRNIPAGTHVVRVRDRLGCLDEETIRVTQPSPIRITRSFITPTGSCATGRIDSLQITGGTAPYEVSANGGFTFVRVNTGMPIINLVSGTYRLIIRDANSCIQETLIFVRSSAVPFVTINSVSVTNRSCFGVNDGSISINASGPGGANLRVTVDGSDPATSPTALPLVISPLRIPAVPGVYDVRVANVTPSQACSSPAGLFRVEVTQPDNLVIDRVNVTNRNCATGEGGRIEVIATGGSGQIEFSIDNGINYQDSPIFTNLLASNYNFPIPEYQILVRDKVSGCVTRWANRVDILNQTTTVLVLDSPDGFNTTCPTSADGRVRVNVLTRAEGLPIAFPVRVFMNEMLVHTFGTAGVSVNHLVTNLAAGVYRFRTVDNRGCTDEQTISIVNPRTITTRIETTNPTGCGGNDGQMRIFVSGGREFEGQRVLQVFENGGLIRTVVIPTATDFVDFFDQYVAGNFDVRVVNVGAACSTSTSVQLREPGTPTVRTVETTAANNELCTNGTVNVLTAGGGINVQYELRSADDRVLLGPQTSRRFVGVPTGEYVIAVRTGLGVDEPFCYSYSARFRVECTGVRQGAESVVAQNLISIYPNPNQGTFGLDFVTTSDLPTAIELLDVSGRVVYRQEMALPVGENQWTVNEPTLSAGMYLLRWRHGAMEQVMKVVVE
jgi:hypothetical protein